MGRAISGCSVPTPVANAKADAEWPDGNEKLPGMLIGSGRSNRRRGGRSRRARYFSGRLTRVEVIAIATTPRSAARRARSPPKIAMAAAIVSQSIDRLALLLNRFRLR